jgi:hypothetical protein
VELDHVELWRPRHCCAVIDREVLRTGSPTRAGSWTHPVRRHVSAAAVVTNRPMRVRGPHGWAWECHPGYHHALVSPGGQEQ